MVQPKIDPLHEAAGDITVVVFQKDNTVFEASFAAEFVNFLDECLAGVVTWMRFACENELHGPRCIVEQSLQPFLVAEQEGAAFISREASGKADRQNFRIENAISPADGFG